MTNSDDLIFKCPNCDSYVAISENNINCGIFRHGFNKDTKNPLNPHEKKEICLKLKAENKLIGCGYPFKIVRFKNEYLLVKCDWI